MKTAKKHLNLFLLLLVMICALPLNVQAASKARTGVYQKSYKVSGPWASGVRRKPTTSLVVTKLTKKKVSFVVEHYGINGSPLYQTNTITAPLKKNKVAKFKWEDSWGNKGTGSLFFSKNKVQVKMKVKKSSKFNRFYWDESVTLKYKRKLSAKDKAYFSHLKF